MANVVIPLAGKDERFEKRGVYKPFIKVEGKYLIKFCTDALNDLFSNPDTKIIFLVLREHEIKFKVHSKLKELYPLSEVIFVEKQTEGAACTVLLAKDRINTDEELIIYLADIYFKGDVLSQIKKYKKTEGFIPTFKSNNVKYSYAVTSGGKVKRVAEKEVISEDASAGFYYFRKGTYFIRGAEEMIKDENKRAGLGKKKWFFICPVYNELIKEGLEIRTIDVEFKFDLGDDNFIEKYLGSNNGK